jgi:hypothetical protein
MTLLAAVALSRSWQAAGGRGSVTSASAAVAAAVVGFLALSSIWGADHQLAKSRSDYAKVPKGTAAVAGAGPAYADNNFTEWLRRALPAHARFYVVPTTVPDNDPSNYQWTTFRLSPRTAEPYPKQAQYIVFWGVKPRDTDLDLSKLQIVSRYDKTRSVARWR